MFLLKGRYPFVYAEIKVPSNKIDVNLHPSKMEILLECEGDIIQNFGTILEKTIKTNDSSPMVSINVRLL